MKLFQQKKRKGFTLVEMLVCVAVMVLIGLAVGYFQENVFYYNNSIYGSLGAQLGARTVLRNIVTELRGASPSSLGAYPVDTAGTSTLIFYSDIDSGPYKERLRYFIQGTNLMRGVITPSGSPLVYNTANEAISTIVTNVVNSTSTPIFDYFDGNYAGTSTPLTQPVNILSVRLVRATVIINPDPNRFPVPITVTSEATLRNLKDNL